MILLNIFCPECTPWLLLMLAGAWMLGWMFWSLFKGQGYKSRISELEGQVTAIGEDNLNLKTEINEARYEVEKREGEFSKLRLKLGDLDLKYKVRGEELDAAIAQSQGGKAEVVANLQKKLKDAEQLAAKYQAMLPTDKSD